MILGQMHLFKRKNVRSGMTSLIISNEKTNDIMKLIESPEDSDSLIRGVSETIQTEAKVPKGRLSECH